MRCTGDADLEDGGEGTIPRLSLLAEKARFPGVQVQMMIGNATLISGSSIAVTLGMCGIIQENFILSLGKSCLWSARLLSH